MPELPEVENVKNGLNQIIVGKKIFAVEVLWNNIIANPEEPAQFIERLKGKNFSEVDRRGKFLLFHIENLLLISHLRMEGKYEWVKHSAPLSKHTHVRFICDGGMDLRYNDVRKFGRMSLIEASKINKIDSLNKLGPEPFKESFVLDEFVKELKKHKKSIKAVLLDQTAVAGLGNIYCDEVLFDAAIHPVSSAEQLSVKETKNLHHSILKIMNKAVEQGGTTIRTYKNAFGKSGNFQNNLKVYGKEGTACQRCGQTIDKIKVAQRGTHVCINCQKLKKGEVE
ncbi:DNA-formamidopyrimidine glycosylase [Lacticigenium naphthae]|uniref:DNA-formamidopyrimidine glycosylase n=1 Tax=Lacticigenium naphthae TaxID=515351 RepID=UPI0003F60D60|nr:DNA-formamidopyrimidine glycosylase [Lacticigenium naphthae]